MFGALARLGGVLIAPRRTLWNVVTKGDGSVFEVLPWMVLVSLTVAPQAAGQAILLMRVEPGDGILSLASIVVNRMLVPVLGALGGALALMAFGGLSKKPIEGFDFDRALDACMYLLIPYLLLAAIGAALFEFGVELWFLPHRTLKGNAAAVAIRVLAGYGWSLLLFGLLTWDIVRGRKAAA